MIDALYSFLFRIGYTDPLHSPVTHVPIGLVIGALIFIIVALIFRRERLQLTARHAAILAFIFVFPTVLFGVFDWLHFHKGGFLPAIRAKMILAAAVLVILGAAIIVGGEVKLRSATVTVLYALAFLCVVGLGYFGGKLVGGVYAALGSEAASLQASVAPPAPAQPGTSQPAATAMSPGPSADVKAGGAVFAADCQACHAGGGNIVLATLPLKSARQLGKLADFVAFIRAPKMPDGSAGSMPPFDASVISDQQASQLYQYIVSEVQTKAW